MNTLANRMDDPRAWARSWRRMLDDASFAGPLPDAYAFGEPYLSFNGLVLTPAEAVSLRRVTEVFVGVFAKAAAAIAEDDAAVQAMGFPWPAVELLQEEPPQPVLLGRFDFGLDGAGHWQLFEFNSDTPSGIREATIAEGLIHRRAGAGTRRLTRGLSHRLAAAVDRRLAAFTARTGRPANNVGVITQVSYQEDVAQSAFFCDLLQARWTAQGQTGRRAVLGDLNNAWAEGDGLQLLGRPLDALYRLYPYEQLYGHPLFAPLYDAVTAGRLCLLNGLRGFLPQSKAVMAWLWRERVSARFTPEEQDVIAAHLPPTYRLDQAPPETPRAAWVVKEFWGREGEEVYLGDGMTDDDWARCLTWGTFIAQQRIATQEVVGLRLEDEVAVPVPAWASVGAFVSDGKFAGCYSRVGGDVIDARAKFLATLEARE